MLDGWAMYASPGPSSSAKVWPLAERQTRPRPVMSDVPQCTSDNLVDIVGLTLNLLPVHARSEAR